MRSVAIDLTGQTFGRLTVIGRAPREPRFGKRAAWQCRCECDRIVNVIGKNLRTGNSTSCGCLHDQLAREIHTKHLQCNSGAYRSWYGAKTRCYNTNCFAYRDYGARGITMSEEWRGSFSAFLRDMGPRPEGTSLDRINNNGPYAKDNCRWAPRLIQANNCRTNRFLDHGGQSMTVSQWEREMGLKSGTIKRRLLQGWTIDRAITQPFRAQPDVK